MGRMVRNVHNPVRAHLRLVPIGYKSAKMLKALKAKLKKANKLINEFDPDENFVFEDGSEELEESVREYLKGEG